MKKLLAILLAVMLIAALTACAAKNEEPNAAEITETLEEEPEYDPQLGVIIEGENNALAEPVVIVNNDSMKITFENSQLIKDSNIKDKYSICYWIPTYTVENKTDKELNVLLCLPEESPYYLENSFFTLKPGETATNSEPVFFLSKDDDNYIDSYDCYEQITFGLISPDVDAAPGVVTLFGLTIGGPYEAG